MDFIRDNVTSFTATIQHGAGYLNGKTILNPEYAFTSAGAPIKVS